MVAARPVSHTKGLVKPGKCHRDQNRGAVLETALVYVFDRERQYHPARLIVSSVIYRRLAAKTVLPAARRRVV